MHENTISNSIYGGIRCSVTNPDCETETVCRSDDCLAKLYKGRDVAVVVQVDVDVSDE